MSLPIALQLYTVRDVVSKDPDAGLAQVAGLGYANVELAGDYGLAPEALRALLDKHNLTAVAAHVGLNFFESDMAGAIANAKVLGYENLILPWVGKEWQTPEGYRKLAGLLSDAAKVAGDAGMTVGYHNHAFEFETLDDGSFGYEILTEEADEAVAFEMDVYWVVRGGHDPHQWLNILAGRVPLLHMKDMANTPEQGFAEVGTGTIDLAAVAGQAVKAQVETLVIEQDSNWKDNDPMNSARVGLANLTQMLG